MRRRHPKKEVEEALAAILEDHADDVAAINAALTFAKLRSRVPAKLRSAIDRLAIAEQPRRGTRSTRRALAS